MGCGGSKDADADKKIDNEFKRTKLGKFDEIFDSAATALESCEKIREGLEDTKEEAQKLSNTYKLKDPKFQDSLQILLWALSVEGKGKINDVGLKVGADAPYLTLDGSKCMHETMSLYDQFTTYVTTVVEAPDNLNTAITKLNELVEKVPDAVKNAKDDLNNSGLGFKEKAEAVVNINKNAAKLPKELNKCKNLATLLNQAATDLHELVPKLQGLVKEADVEGAKLVSKNIWRLADIFEESHKGERKPNGGVEHSDNKKKDEKKDEKKDAKKDEKKDAKKDEKKDAKKDEKKDEKKAEKKEEKNDEKKEEN